MKNLPSNPRDVDVYFRYGEEQLPYFVNGWEELYLISYFVERAIYCIKHMTEQISESQKICLEKYAAKFITIPFEKYVLG
jgi:hypothetical protein